MDYLLLGVTFWGMYWLLIADGMLIPWQWFHSSRGHNPGLRLSLIETTPLLHPMIDYLCTYEQSCNDLTCYGLIALFPSEKITPHRLHAWCDWDKGDPDISLIAKYFIEHAQYNYGKYVAYFQIYILVSFLMPDLAIVENNYDPGFDVCLLIKLFHVIKGEALREWWLVVCDQIRRR